MYKNDARKEQRRIESLQSFHILDTLPEREFDDLTLLASRICETPIATINLVDENRQWFKSRVGLTSTETPRDIAFCDTTIKGEDLFIVPDTTLDARFSGNPVVTKDPNIRFYAGAFLEYERARGEKRRGSSRTNRKSKACGSAVRAGYSRFAYAGN